jgi:hypothetical protein
MKFDILVALAVVLKVQRAIPFEPFSFRKGQRAAAVSRIRVIILPGTRTGAFL